MPRGNKARAPHCVAPLDEQVFDRIARGVDELGDHGVAIQQSGDTRLDGGPQVFPSAPARIHAAREHLVEVLHELGITTVAIEEHRVMVIGLGHRQQNIDAESVSGLAEAIRERFVGLAVGPEQELTLRAATGE